MKVKIRRALCLFDECVMRFKCRRWSCTAVCFTPDSCALFCFNEGAK